MTVKSYFSAGFLPILDFLEFENYIGETNPAIPWVNIIVTGFAVSRLRCISSQTISVAHCMICMREPMLFKRAGKLYVNPFPVIFLISLMFLATSNKQLVNSEIFQFSDSITNDRYTDYEYRAF